MATIIVNYFIFICVFCVCGTVSWNPGRLAYCVVDNNSELLTSLLSLPKRKGI